MIQISASCLRFAHADSALCFAPPTQGIASAISTQPSARRSLPILPVMPRHPEARPASEPGRLLPCVMGASVYPALRRGCKAGTEIWPYDIKLPFLEMSLCVFPRAAHHRKPVHHTVFTVVIHIRLIYQDQDTSDPSRESLRSEQDKKVNQHKHGYPKSRLQCNSRCQVPRYVHTNQNTPHVVQTIHSNSPTQIPSRPHIHSLSYITTMSPPSPTRPSSTSAAASSPRPCRSSPCRTRTR